MPTYKVVRFYRTREVASLFGVSQSTVWRWLKVGTLPRPAHAPGGWSMWPADEIDRVFADRLYERAPGMGRLVRALEEDP